MFLAACSHPEAADTTSAPPAAPTPAPNVERGQQLSAQYGCGVCHVIPGVPGAEGALGPSLAGVALRPMISEGVVQNTPENMVRYIQNPGSLNPQSSMPALAIPPADAEAIATFLFTLK